MIFGARFSALFSHPDIYCLMVGQFREMTYLSIRQIIMHRRWIHVMHINIIVALKQNSEKFKNI